MNDASNEYEAEDKIGELLQEILENAEISFINAEKGEGED
jgi:hypothetical protein